MGILQIIQGPGAIGTRVRTGQQDMITQEKDMITRKNIGGLKPGVLAYWLGMELGKAGYGVTVMASGSK